MPKPKPGLLPRHADEIACVLSCYDRVVIRGTPAGAGHARWCGDGGGQRMPKTWRKVMIWRGVLAGAGATIAIFAGLLFSPYWLFVWDGSTAPSGVYFCGNLKSGTDSVRECVSGGDILILRVVRHSDGSVEESLFARNSEVMRRAVDPSGKATTVYRQVADCWDGPTGRSSLSSPEGQSGVSCSTNR